MTATTKIVEIQPLQNLASRYLEVKLAIEKLTAAQAKVREEISRRTQLMMLSEIDEGNFIGNYSFSTNHGDLRVNCRVARNATLPLNHKALKDGLGEAYDELVIKKNKWDVTSSPKTIKKQFSEHPEVFQLQIKSTARLDKLVEIYEANPDLFDISIKNQDTYAETYPKSVEDKGAYCPANGLIEKLGKLGDNFRKRTLKVLRTFFENNIEMYFS